MCKIISHFLGFSDLLKIKMIQISLIIERRSIIYCIKTQLVSDIIYFFGFPLSGPHLLSTNPKTQIRAIIIIIKLDSRSTYRIPFLIRSFLVLAEQCKSNNDNLLPDFFIVSTLQKFCLICLRISAYSSYIIFLASLKVTFEV